jgi:hypothetical protein
LGHIEFVEHSVIADSQFEFGAALEPLVREIFQLCAYVIHFALDGVSSGFRQGIKCLENVGDQI